MNRPSHLTDADWADYQKCQAEHDNLTAQAADREALLEHDLIDDHDEYAFDYTLPEPLPQPARQVPPPNCALSRGRSRWR